MIITVYEKAGNKQSPFSPPPVTARELISIMCGKGAKDRPSQSP